MLFRSFLTSLLIMTALPAFGDDYESADTLKTSVERYLTELLLSELNITDANNIEVYASNLDPRLKLKKCQKEIEQRITSPKPYGSNVTVKLNCTGQSRWAIYVPAQISIYNDIAVLSHNMNRGDVLKISDIALQRIDTTTGNDYVLQPSRLVGMQLQRRLGTGQALRLSYVKPATIVRKGDKVILEAGTTRFSVVTGGLALTDGGLGQQIRVQNTQSKRIIDAKIIAPGRAKVIM